MSRDHGGNSERGRQFDLEERTAAFGETVIRFAKRIPPGDITSPLISQLVRAATSVGANWCEADDAGSKKGISIQDQPEQA